MLQKLLIATGNPSKAKEIGIALIEFPLEILTLNDLENRPNDPEENGVTFKENALIKAKFWFDQTGIISLADDSGILVDALPDELGVHTVRFGAGPDASDEEWLEHFLQRLKHVPPAKRTAKFVCVLALVQPREETKFFFGEVHGKITEKAEAPILPRIPLSSVFIPDGSDKVFAAMTKDEKGKWSHRGRAIQELKKFLINSPIL